jgi:RNA binding exosome subunit
MDGDLDGRLQEIEDLAGVAATRECIDILDVRNELERVEGRLIEYIDKSLDEAVGHLGNRIESIGMDINDLKRVVGELQATAEAIQSELPEA